MLRFLLVVRGFTLGIGALCLSALSVSLWAQPRSSAQHQALRNAATEERLIPFDDLENVVNELSEVYSREGRWTEMMEVMRSGATVAERQGDWLVARRWLQKGITLASDQGLTSDEASALNQLADLLSSTRNRERSMELWELAVSRYRDARDPEKAIEVSLKLAINAAFMGNREVALRWAGNAQSSANLLGDLLWVARAEHHRALVYFILAGVDVPSVADWVSREWRDPDDRLGSEAGMGVSRKVALDTLEGAIRQYTRLRDYLSLAECLRLKAEVIALDGSNAEVRALFYEARQSELRVQNARFNPLLRLSEARFLRKIGEHALALEQLREALSLLQGRDLMRVRIVHADWLLQMGDEGGSESTLNALAQDPMLGRWTDAASEYQRVRAAWHLKRGEHEESSAAMARATDLRFFDLEQHWSLLLEEQVEEMAQATKLSGEQIALLELEISQSEEAHKQMLIAVGAGCGLLLLLLVVLLIFRELRLRSARRKSAEIQAALDAVELRLKHYNEERNLILKNLSQELRTPMSGIVGVLPLLQDSSGSTLQENCINIIDISSRSILTLIEDLADFAKLETGNLTLHRRPMNLVRTVEAVVQVFRADSKSTEIELVCEVPSDPLPVVLGDAGRIQQILLNLIARAFRTTRSGSIHVRLDTPSGEADLVMTMHIVVEDTGESLDAASIEQVFELSPYPTHIHTVAKPASMLGMSIARQVVETMGGKLSLSAQETGGMRAEVILPLSVDQASKQARPLEPYVRFPRKLALVIAYHQSTRRLICRHLRLWGMQHEMAEDLDTAQPYLSGEFAFDMVFLDLDRSDPGLNLSEKIHALRQSECNRMVPIVLMAPLSDWSPPSEIYRHRYLHRISKPILVEELHYTVRLALTYKSPLTRSYASFSPEGDPVDSSDSDEGSLEGAMDGFQFVPYILPFRSDAPIRPDLRILLAEDNVVNQKVTSLLLRKIGFTIDVVSSGTEAVEAVRGGDYDVVLMDKLMPSMDGLEATTEIRKLEGVRQPVIIALTASASMEDEIACRKASMDNFLSKPVRFEKMKAALAFASSIVDQRRPKVVSKTKLPEDSVASG